MNNWNIIHIHLTAEDLETEYLILPPSLNYIPLIIRQFQNQTPKSSRRYESSQRVPDLIAAYYKHQKFVVNLLFKGYWQMILKDNTVKAKPFVKWVGGKSQLLNEVRRTLPTDLSQRKGVTYVEPFVGGGAVLFWIVLDSSGVSEH